MDSSTSLGSATKTLKKQNIFSSHNLSPITFSAFARLLRIPSLNLTFSHLLRLKDTSLRLRFLNNPFLLNCLFWQKERYRIINHSLKRISWSRNVFFFRRSTQADFILKVQRVIFRWGGGSEKIVIVLIEGTNFKIDLISPRIGLHQQNIL